MFGKLFSFGKRSPEAEPATPRQIDFARQLGVKNCESLTKELAPIEIDKKLAAKARRRKGWISSLQDRIEKLEKQLAAKPSGRKPKTKKKRK